MCARAFPGDLRACWCWCTCTCRCGGVVSAVRVRGLSRGGPPQLQDVWVRLLEVVEGAEGASLDVGHVLLLEVGVVLDEGVWAEPQQRHEARCHHARAERYGGGARGVGPVRFVGASLCCGRSVTFHSHRSVEISEVRWVHLARPYIALPRSWLQLRMESRVSRDLRSQLPQMWGSSGASSLVYLSGAGLCGGGGRSRRGGGSRCPVPPFGQLVRGTRWCRRCRVCCT